MLNTTSPGVFAEHSLVQRVGEALQNVPVGRLQLLPHRLLDLLTVHVRKSFRLHLVVYL